MTVCVHLWFSLYRTDKNSWKHTIFTPTDSWRDLPEKVNKQSSVWPYLICGHKVNYVSDHLFWFTGRKSQMVQTDESILLSTEARSLLELKIADNKERLEEQDSSEDEVWFKYRVSGSLQTISSAYIYLKWWFLLYRAETTDCSKIFPYLRRLLGCSCLWISFINHTV